LKKTRRLISNIMNTSAFWPVVAAARGKMAVAMRADREEILKISAASS